MLLRGLLIHFAFRDLREQLIGFFLFIESLFKELERLVVAHHFRPRAKRAVCADFIVLDFLCESDQLGVSSGAWLELFHVLACLLDKPHHSATNHAGWLFAEGLTCLLDPSHVLFGLSKVVLKSFFQTWILRHFRHLWQGLCKLLFCIVNVFYSVNEQFVQRFHSSPRFVAR